MKIEKILLAICLISTLAIAGCTQASTQGTTGTPQGQPPQQPSFEPLTDRGVQLVMTEVKSLGYDNITDVSSDESITSIAIDVQNIYQETDVTRIFEILRNHATTGTYTVGFVITKGSTTTSDDIHCLFTGTKEQIDQLISKNWIDWKTKIEEATC